MAGQVSMWGEGNLSATWQQDTAHSQQTALKTKHKAMYMMCVCNRFVTGLKDWVCGNGFEGTVNKARARRNPKPDLHFKKTHAVSLIRRTLPHCQQLPPCLRHPCLWPAHLRPPCCCAGCDVTVCECRATVIMLCITSHGMCALHAVGCETALLTTVGSLCSTGLLHAQQEFKSSPGQLWV